MLPAVGHNAQCYLALWNFDVVLQIRRGMAVDRPQVDAVLDTELYDRDPLSSPLRPLKRVPSFSCRPGFPKGLQVCTAYLSFKVHIMQEVCLQIASAHVQVLLVETDRQSRDKVSKQLKQLSYVGKCLDCLPLLSASRRAWCVDLQYPGIYHLSVSTERTAGTCCASTAEAAVMLHDNSRQFDIVLAEVCSYKAATVGSTCVASFGST